MSSYKFPSSRVSNGALKETILCGILELIAIIVVCLRLWARRMRRKRLEFNDYAIIVALFLCTGLLAITITCKSLPITLILSNVCTDSILQLLYGPAKVFTHTKLTPHTAAASSLPSQPASLSGAQQTQQSNYPSSISTLLSSKINAFVGFAMQRLLFQYATSSQCFLRHSWSADLCSITGIRKFMAPVTAVRRRCI